VTINGPDFAVVYFAIWLGPRPISTKRNAQMLVVFWCADNAIATRWFCLRIWFRIECWGTAITPYAKCAEDGQSTAATLVAI
jgi:hypothetical protein